jgi:hypothetical protein
MESFEVQEQLERFTTRFTDRITQATEALERSVRPDVREEALRKCMRYISSAMEIATGLSPEINLLDMITFVHLCRSVLDRHWVPQLYGREGAELAEVFASSEEELTVIARQALGEDKRDQVVRIADSWLAANPGMTRVEGVRLADFSEEAGAAAASRAGQAKGLLASVRTATQTANQAMVLSERALFLLHRMPSVWRLQARLAAREMLRDAVEQLYERPEAPVAKLTREVSQWVRRGVAIAGVAAALGTFMWLRRPTVRCG